MIDTVSIWLSVNIGINDKYDKFKIKTLSQKSAPVAELLVFKTIYPDCHYLQMGQRILTGQCSKFQIIKIMSNYF